MRSLATKAVVTLLAVALATSAATAGSTLTPTQYRAKLNAMCRANTPQIKILEADFRRAQKAQDGRAMGIALGRLIVLTLRQDARIRATPVPSRLKTKMLPTMRLLRQADGIMREILVDATASRVRAMVTGLASLQRMTPSINHHLDAAGLRDCGSNQA
jgi:hypothetical protein